VVELLVSNDRRVRENTVQPENRLSGEIIDCALRPQGTV